MTTIFPFIDKDGKLKLAKNWKTFDDWIESCGIVTPTPMRSYQATCERAKAEAIEVAPESEEAITTLIIEQHKAFNHMGTVYPITVSGRMEERYKHDPVTLDKVAVFIPEEPKEESSPAESQELRDCFAFTHWMVWNGWTEFTGNSQGEEKYWKRYSLPNKREGKTIKELYEMYALTRKKL